MINDLKIIAIQEQLDRIERKQFLLACMVAVLGLAWAIAELFPILAAPLFTV
ncbi:MAG: hypothetical protein AAF739_01425 [Pseudomonadota bacterium]